MTMLDVKQTQMIAANTMVQPAKRLRPRWTLELGLVALLYVAYDTTRGLRHGNLASANLNGERILRWERTLHLDPEHALNQLLWHVPALAVTSSYYYATLHFIITPAVLIWLYRSHPASYRSARTAIALATGSALIVFWLLPTTPPRLLPGSQFHDILAHVHQWGWWGGDGSAPRGFGSLTNQLAAMPSLHVGWALWSGWLIAKHARRRTVRVLGAAYPVLTALVVMGTGNHYFLDTIGGAAVIAISAGVVRLAGWRPAVAGQPSPDVIHPDVIHPDVIDLRDPEPNQSDAVSEADGGPQRRSVRHRRHHRRPYNSPRPDGGGSGSHTAPQPRQPHRSPVSPASSIGT